MVLLLMEILVLQSKWLFPKCISFSIFNKQPLFLFCSFKFTNDCLWVNLFLWLTEMKDNGSQVKGVSINGPTPTALKWRIRKPRGNWHVHARLKHACQTDVCALVVFKLWLWFNSLIRFSMKWFWYKLDYCSYFVLINSHLLDFSI